MKCRVLTAVILTAMTGIFGPAAWAQKSYYVVVGAFSTEGNVKEFTTHLPEQNADTAYAMNISGNMIRLYVMKSTSRDAAAEESLKLQQGIEVGGFGSSGSVETLSVTNEADPEQKNIAQNAGLTDASAGRGTDRTSSTMAASGVSNSRLFKFTISNTHGQDLDGNIHFVDLERGRDLASYPTASYTEIINPGNREEMALVCGVFGYKMVEKRFDASDPSKVEGAYRDASGAWVIPYKLERLSRGDVSVMYNVAFHKDAVVMLPKSKADLDELVFMMKQNPNYEITVHAHCNGKSKRKITALNSEQDFFSTEGSKHVYGTAKMLTTLRADAIRDYLVAHEIDEKRIRTFAWGGRDMLVDPNSTNAKLNDRIEIEIRKD